MLPTNAADASGEISMSAGNQLKWHDGTKVVTIDTTPTNDNYVLKYDNATATFTLEPDATGGTPAWSDITDPTAALALRQTTSTEPVTVATNGEVLEWIPGSDSRPVELAAFDNVTKFSFQKRLEYVVLILPHTHRFGLNLNKFGLF